MAWPSQHNLSKRQCKREKKKMGRRDMQIATSRQWHATPGKELSCFASCLQFKAPHPSYSDLTFVQAVVARDCLYHSLTQSLKSSTAALPPQTLQDRNGFHSLSPATGIMPTSSVGFPMQSQAKETGVIRNALSGQQWMQTWCKVDQTKLWTEPRVRETPLPCRCSGLSSCCSADKVKQQSQVTGKEHW